MATKKVCAVSGCDSPALARGWCNRHYLRWKNHGTPTPAGIAELSRAEVRPDGSKVCTGCNVAQPVDNFDRDKNATGGRRSQCKSCRSRKMADWYKATKPERDAQREVRVARDREKIRRNDMARYRRNRAARIERAAEGTHRRRQRIQESEPAPGITTMALRARDGDKCCHCGAVMDFKPGRRGVKGNPRRASIEHLQPLSRGGRHSWDNVALACIECNVRRGNRG